MVSLGAVFSAASIYSEPDKAFFYYQKDWYMQTEPLTTNKNLVQQLISIVLTKKNMKKDLLLQKITRIQYKIMTLHTNGFNS
jgi:hypothetical protein